MPCELARLIRAGATDIQCAENLRRGDYASCDLLDDPRACRCHARRFGTRAPLKRMPDEEKTTGTVQSRRKVEELLRRTGAQLWIGHSMEFFRTVRKSPAWYD